MGWRRCNTWLVSAVHEPERLQRRGVAREVAMTPWKLGRRGRPGARRDDVRVGCYPFKGARRVHFASPFDGRATNILAAAMDTPH